MKLTEWQKQFIRGFYQKPGEAEQILGFIEGMDEDQPSSEEGVLPR